MSHAAPGAGEPAEGTPREAGEPAEETRRDARPSPVADWAHLPDHLGLTVTRGSVPDTLPGAEQPWPWIQVTPSAALVHFDGDAALLVRDGTHVVIQWDDALDPLGDPSWILQGWAVTLASLQRGDLSLHAATVRIGDTYVAIAGDRGAGKSTTAMGLRGRGHQLLVDDVTLLEFRGREAWTTPYSRNVHLLPDAAEALGLDFDALPPLAGGRDKSAFRAEDPPIDPHRIDLVVVLAPDHGTPPEHSGDPTYPEPSGDPTYPEPVDDLTPPEPVDDLTPPAGAVTALAARGAARVEALIEHTVRDGLAPRVLGEVRYFTLLTRLANAAPVHVLRRTPDEWTLDQVLDLIEGLARDVSAQRT